MRFKLKKISGDASFREFYRMHTQKSTSIIVVAKKEKYKNLFVYSAINQILTNNKILAPKLKKSFFNKGIIEISDFGKRSLYDVLIQKKNKKKEYIKIIKLLTKIQKIKLKKKYIFKNKKITIQKYNIKNLHKETDLFLDWYLKVILSKKKFKFFRPIIRRELELIYKNIYFKNDFFTHRDFHVSNIMEYNKNFAIIDSQDAILGNPFYDLASLIDDVRIKTKTKLKKDLFNLYLKMNPKLRNKTKESISDFHILSVQRNLKILGIFVRLSLRDNKKKYLKYLPHTWKLIESRMNLPIFFNLKKLLDNVVKKKTRGRVIF